MGWGPERCAGEDAGGLRGRAGGGDAERGVEVLRQPHRRGRVGAPSQLRRHRHTPWPQIFRGCSLGGVGGAHFGGGSFFEVPKIQTLHTEDRRIGANNLPRGSPPTTRSWGKRVGQGPAPLKV